MGGLPYNLRALARGAETRHYALEEPERRTLGQRAPRPLGFRSAAGRLDPARSRRADPPQPRSPEEHPARRLVRRLGRHAPDCRRDRILDALRLLPRAARRAGSGAALRQVHAAHAARPQLSSALSDRAGVDAESYELSPD